MSIHYVNSTYLNQSEYDSCVFDTLSLPDKSLTTPKLEIKPFSQLAVEKLFPNLPRYLDQYNVEAFKVIPLNGDTPYERLTIAMDTTFKEGRLKGKKFFPSLHFFNHEAPKEQKETTISWHDHLLPIGVLTMHHEGEIGGLAYEMFTKKIDPSLKSVVITHDFVRYGYAYGLDHPILDSHAIKGASPSISFIVGQKNGIVNSRETNVRRVATPNRTEYLKSVALIAHNKTSEAIKQTNTTS